MAPKTFSAQVDGFVKLTEKNMRYVAVSAIQDVLEAAQTPQVGMTKGATGYVEGKIPVADSTLINSLSVDGGTPDENSYITAILGLTFGKKMLFAWTAPHAMPMETGFTTKSGTHVGGRHFVGANAAKFGSFVANRMNEVTKK